MARFRPMLFIPKGVFRYDNETKKAYMDVTVEENYLVFCEDCKYWDNTSEGRYIGGWCFCERLQFSTSPKWFCADGEERGEA